MSYEEAIKAINEISARLGATAANLYPKLVKYGIVSNGIKSILALLILLVSAFALKKCGKKLFINTDIGEKGIYIAGFIVAVFCFITSAIICCEGIYDLVLWTTVPEIQSINFVLKWCK